MTLAPFSLLILSISFPCVALQTTSVPVPTIATEIPAVSEVNITCSPLGRSSVVVDSQLNCLIIGTATHTFNGSNDRWTTFTRQEGPGAWLVKNATFEDNARTFVCSAITSNDNRTPLSCNIGPLTVVESLPLSTFSAGLEEVTVSPVATTVSNAGLSAAAISGIVVGAIVLIILIAIHTFCCHCNPKKWMTTKSYLVNLRSSNGTGNQGTDSTSSQSEGEMGGSRPYDEPYEPPAYVNEALGETHSNLNEEANQPGTSYKNVSSPSKNPNRAKTKHIYHNTKESLKSNGTDSTRSQSEGEMGGSHPYDEPYEPPAYINEVPRETHSNLNVDASQPRTSNQNVSSYENSNLVKHTKYKNSGSKNITDSFSYEVIMISSWNGQTKPS